MTYAQHIDKLLVEAGIEYAFVSNPLEARYVSYPKRKLFIPNIDKLDDQSYAICLHELGHAFDPIQPTAWRKESDMVEAELRAWEWAVQHAIKWTTVMADMHWRALQSYFTPPRPTAVIVLITE